MAAFQPCPRIKIINQFFSIGMIFISVIPRRIMTYVPTIFGISIFFIMWISMHIFTTCWTLLRIRFTAIFGSIPSIFNG